MKTLMLFEEIPEQSFFCEFDGDLSDFDGVYIGGSGSVELRDKLAEMMWDGEGTLKVPKLEKPTKDWDVFVKCGMVL